MTVTAAERRDAIEAIRRRLVDRVAEAVSEALDAIDRIGGPAGPLDPTDRDSLGEQPVSDPAREAFERRFDAAIEKVPHADLFEPTPFGEALAVNMVALAVKTAPEDHWTPVYAKCEEWLLDDLMADLRSSVVRRVQAVVEAIAAA